MKTAQQVEKSNAADWIRFKAGEEDAFALVFRSYYSYLFHYGVKFTNGDQNLAKDCIQELFMYLWRNRSSLEGVKSIPCYLLKSYRNKIIRSLTDHHVKKTSPFQEGEHGFQLVNSFEDLIIEQEVCDVQRENLASALANLSVRQREAIYLKFYKGLKYDEIGEVMGLQYQSVRNYIHQAICHLRKDLSPAAIVSCLLLLNLREF